MTILENGMCEFCDGIIDFFGLLFQTYCTSLFDELVLVDQWKFLNFLNELDRIRILGNKYILFHGSSTEKKINIQTSPNP